MISGVVQPQDFQDERSMPAQLTWVPVAMPSNGDRKEADSNGQAVLNNAGGDYYGLCRGDVEETKKTERKATTTSSEEAGGEEEENDAADVGVNVVVIRESWLDSLLAEKPDAFALYVCCIYMVLGGVVWLLIFVEQCSSSIDVAIRTLCFLWSFP